MGQVRKSQPRFRRAGTLPHVELTDDDIDILKRVFRHRFIRADDIYRLYPERSADKLSRRLTRLYRSQFLDRPIAQIDRFRGGGSQPLVYGLDTAGARYLAETYGTSVGSGDWKTRNRRYTRDNLDHTLAITSYLVDLELACRTRAEAELITWDEILAAAPETTRRLAQPGRWSVQLSLGHQAAEVQVVPDAVFGLRIHPAGGEARRTFAFLEMDRGTMTVAPARAVRESEAFLYRATILRKLLAYAESHRAASPREHLGIPIARVLFLTHSLARARTMQQAAERFVVNGGAPAGLFLFGAFQPGGDPLAAELLDAAGRPARLGLGPASTG